jgi:A/G-specific adenine glycosylase
MLQQTTVKAVKPYYERFVARFPTLGHLARAPVDRVLAAWSGLGYYRRARHLHAAARLVRSRHGGRLPDSPGDLLALPGIGRYTAGAILSIAYGRREPLVDGNVARVLSRLLLLRGDPRSSSAQSRLWAAARTLVEASGAPGDLNQALMELGASVCAPAAPDCPACPAAFACAARAAGVQEKVPGRRRAAPTVRLRQIVALVRRDGRVLVRRRGRTGLMDGLWELPVVRADGRDGSHDELRIALGRRLAGLSHSVTFRRFDVEVRQARLLEEPRGRGFRWVDPAAARRLPASSLLPKILDRIGALD